MARNFLGNSISVGNGIKAYFYIKPEYLNASTANSTLQNGLAFEVGIINDLMCETNRDVAPQFISGNKNAVSYSSGKRLTSGKISFSILDRDFIDYFINDFLKQDKLKGIIKDTAFDTNRFGTETNGASTFVVEKDIEYLDQMPPVDIILIGSAEVINSMASNTSDREIFQIGDNFSFDAYFTMKLENVRFLNDGFGITAASPLKDQVLDFIVCGKRIPWYQIKN